MDSTEYEPGTVAIATVRGRAGVRVMRGVGDDGWGWVTADKVETWRVHEDRLVHDVHPLVVLDLSPHPENVTRLLAQAIENDDDLIGLKPMLHQIEAQTKPPRIVEPGLWGVVEAGVRSAFNRLEYVRASDGYWYALRGAQRSWGELIDPTLIREGVES